MNHKLIDNGKSEYVIALSDSVSSLDKIAGDIFRKYIEKSTGVSLEIVSESSIKNQKFVSIGDTKLLKNKNFKVSYGVGGIAFIEDDGNLYLFGDGASDAIWAVETFLEQAINYKFYAIDQIEFDKKSDIDITGIHYEYTPTISNRSFLSGKYSEDLEYATGLKMYAGIGFRADGSPFWGAWDDIYYSCHNHLTIMPLKKYYDAHPEWYNEEKTQLCLSNKEMRDEFFNNFIGILKQYDTQEYFILGHEDIADMCHCPNCQKMIDVLKPGGLHLDFTNDMARRTEKWRKENCPERKITIGMFAYSTASSLIPPVKREGDKIVPIIKAEPNVIVMFAPCGAKEHHRPITDPANKFHLRCLEHWNLVCKRFAMWMYYGSFRRTFEFAEGIYMFKENIKKLSEFGVEYYFLQSKGTNHALVFQKMHLYVFSQLIWDVSKDTDTLIDEFMNKYYMSAAPYMRKMFDYLMAHMQKVRDRHEYLTGRPYYRGMCGSDVNYDGIWDLNVVYDLSLILDDAIKAVENANYSNELKTQLKDRIEVERLFLVYIQLEYFVKELGFFEEARSINFFPEKRALELIDIMKKGCEKYNIDTIDGDELCEESYRKWQREANFTSRQWENEFVIKFWKMLDDLWEKYTV